MSLQDRFCFTHRAGRVFECCPGRFGYGDTGYISAFVRQGRDGDGCGEEDEEGGEKDHVAWVGRPRQVRRDER